MTMSYKLFSSIKYQNKNFKLEKLFDKLFFLVALTEAYFLGMA